MRTLNLAVASLDEPVPALAAGPTRGPLVLLLHGFPQTKAAWAEVLPHLGRAGYRAVAYDQRGYRAGRKPGRPCTLPELGDEVLAVADTLGADRLSVVGHDWGAAVAWELAASRPDRVTAMAAVATPHPRALVRSMAGTQLLRSSYVAAFKTPLVPEVVLRAGRGAVLRRMLTMSGLDDDDADAYVEAMLEPGVLSGALAWYRDNSARTLLAVGRVAVPTMYVWPSADAALGRGAADRTAGFVDGPYRFEIMEGCPHWVPERRPAELAALLVQHLHEASASQPPTGGRRHVTGP